MTNTAPKETPALPFAEIAEKFANTVTPAEFPIRLLRYYNKRWAKRIGFEAIPQAQIIEHFGAFAPLPDNLPRPLAMRYHGHQFGVYNPELGDGRGFLFAQIRDEAGRLLDLGTKGSGETPWSRQGDGRLTLKGGVREVLAPAYLEALGVNTSKAFSLIETGEALQRGDEPSPTRSAVLVRLSHSHIRFGTFQYAAYHDDAEALAKLVSHCATNYHPDALDPDMGRQTAALFERIVEATARMIGQWMAAGFVHGVMNTDNFNITGETFDFGPYRFLPVSDPNFVAAYFDQQGLYRFGRQPAQGLWALQQLGGALTLIADADDLSKALSAYEPAYQKGFARCTLALLGLNDGPSLKDDLAFLQGFYGWLTESGANWAQTFFDLFGGEAGAMRRSESPAARLYASDGFASIGRQIDARTPDRPGRLDHAYFQAASPVSMVIDRIEDIWSDIAEKDDWAAFENHLAHIEQARQAYAWDG